MSIYSENIKGNVDSEDPAYGNIDSDDAIPGTVSTGSSSARIIFPFPSVAYFPLMGKANALYIDKSAKPNVAYRWDSDESAYVMVGGAGGSGGVTDYTQLSNLPMINGNILTGDLSSTELGIGDGEDGGYYVPSVDADGNLSWTASDEGMPDVDSDNIKGNDGVGIQSVEQTTTSTEDNGENVITVTKTDGSQSTFKVRNGGKGNNGFSPTIETSKIENGHEVKFNDVNSSNVIKVMDGAALLYVVSPDETIEEARIAAKAAGAKFIFNPYVANSVEYVTAESFNNLFDARNGAVKIWGKDGATWSAAAGSSLTVAVTGGSTGCTEAGNLSDFKFFIFSVLGIPLLMQLHDGVLLGGSIIYSAASSALVTRGIRATVSDNTFTIEKHSTSVNGNVSSNIVAIYGIPTR